MPARKSRTTVAIAFLASLLVHAVVIGFVPITARGGSAKVRADEMMVMLEPMPPPEPAPQPMPQEPVLGLNAPLPPSLTWLGFTEFEPQFGPPAEFEQAAFTNRPLAAAPRPSPAEAAPKPPQQESRESTPSELVKSHNAPADENKPSSRQSDAQPAKPAMLEILEQFQREMVLAKELQDANAKSQPAEPRPAQTPASASPPPAAAPSPQNKPVSPQPTDGETEPGVESDKQSPPASVIEVPRDQWQLGKPLAGKGLELKPRRPSFTLLTMMTAVAGNPLCEMSFNREGKVVAARIVERSGDWRIDEAILNSLYYWRASGEELDRLDGERTLDLQIRIMLSRRRS